MMNTNRPQPRIPLDMSPFGDWFGEVFRLYGAQWRVYVVQGLIVVALSAVFPIIGYVVMMVTMFTSMPSGRSSGPPDASIFAGFGLFYGLCFLGSFVMAFLYPGMVYTALKQMRGVPISVGDLFGAMRYGWGYLLIIVLLTVISLVTCGIGGILAFFATGVIALAIPLMVD